LMLTPSLYLSVVQFIMPSPLYAGAFNQLHSYEHNGSFPNTS
jgi:hypothetical protein